MIKLQILLTLGALALSACSSPSANVEVIYQPDASVADYITSLERLSLADTSMGSAWIAASIPGKNQPKLSLPPFRELRHFDAGIPEAAWYLIEGVRGQTITIELLPSDGLSYFADLFGIAPPFDPADNEAPEVEATASAHFLESDSKLRTGRSAISFEPRGSRYFLLRVLPRLLEGGTIEVVASTKPIASVWPVDNTSRPDIWSVFGDSRDGGRRVHHGIDIFAPRGTPIRAPMAGRITRVGERDLGGLSVSIMDDQRRISMYFAHLDEYGDIEAGQYIEAGHIIGTVGNTGNAITTPPHLHLGFYDRGWGGAVDPWYFLMGIDQARANEAFLEQAWGDFLQQYPLGSRFSYDPAALVTLGAFYIQSPGTSPIIRSPARRDASGKLLELSDLPTLRTSWDRPYRPSIEASEDTVQNARTSFVPHLARASIRLVALREGGAGFLFPNGQMYWVNHSLVRGVQRSTVLSWLANSLVQKDKNHVGS